MQIVGYEGETAHSHNRSKKRPKPIPSLGFDDFTTPHTIYSLLSPITVTLCITIDVYLYIYICRKVNNPTKLNW